MRWVILVASLVVFGPIAAAQTPGETSEVQGARAIESRLLAPCCWNGTLDAHESPLADTLRAEIRARLRRGESGASIEADLVARYGDRVRAVPRDGDTRPIVPVVVGLAMLVSVAMLARFVRRRTRREEPAGPAAALESKAPRDDYDARLDEELARLDDA